MSISTELSYTVRIRNIQNQLRIAVQNHQVLYMRNKVCPRDPEIQNHLNVLQGLIISMGRSQAELLAEHRLELIQTRQCKECDVDKFLARLLSWGEVPKGIPVYVKYRNGSTTGLSDEKKTAWKKKNPSPKVKKQAFKVTPRLQSVFKVSNTAGLIKKENNKLIIDSSKIKIVKSFNDTITLRSKRLQSVLKSKSNVVKPLLKNYQEKGKSVNDKTDDTLVNSEPSSPSSSDIKDKRSSRSNSPEDLELSEINSSKNRSFTRLRTSAKRKAELAITDKNLSSRFKLDDSKDADDFPLSIEELSQEVFLGFFGLISKARGDAIKSKRYERKRRSVAGQSNFYNDYFQHPVLPRRNCAQKKSPSSSCLASPVSQVTVEVAADIDDDEEKQMKVDKNCVVCNESGNLESCFLCSEYYHAECAGDDSNACPSCTSQSVSIKNIVGANSASSASSSELIMRYLSPHSSVEEDDKKTESNESKN